MGAAVEQEIRVKIKALVDGLKNVQELQSAVKHLQSQGNKKLGVEPDAKGAFKFVTVLREISPAADSAVSKVEGLSNAGGALGVVFGLLAGAGVAVSAAVFKVAKDAADAGSEIYDMSQRTELSAELLSILKVQAEQSGSSLETVAGGAVKFNKSLVEAAQGNKELSAALKFFGLDAKTAFRDPEASLERFIRRFNELPDGAAKNTLAMKLFKDRSGELLPVIKSFGTDVEGLKKKLTEMGVVWTAEGAAKADAFGDTLTELGQVARGAGNVFGQEVMPEITGAMREITGEFVENRETVREWGRAFGDTIRGVRAILDSEAGTIIYWLARIAAEISPVVQIARLVRMAGASSQDVPAEFDAGNSVKIDPRTMKPVVPAGDLPPGGGGGKKGGGGKPFARRLEELAAQQEKAEADLASAESTARADSITDSLEREKDLITRQLEARLISYREYYAALARIETEAIDQEILRQLAALDRIQSELNAKRREVDADKKLKPAEREARRRIAGTEADAKAAPVLEKINELERERQDVTSKVAAEARKTTEEYQRQLSTIRGELLSLNGGGDEAAKREIDERFREVRERAVANGDAAAVAVIDALKKRLRQSAQFEEVERRIRDVFQRIRDAEDFHDAEAAAGQISPEEADRRKLAAARAQRGELERLHGELKGIAQATKDPELQAAVDRLGVEIAQVGVEVDHLARDINRDLKQALDDTLFAIIRRQQTLKEAVTSLVNHVLDELARLASSAIIERLFGENGIFGGVFNSKGGQGGIGGILSGIFRPRQGTNPQAPQGTTSVLDTLPGVIKNFQAGATGGLRDVNQSTKGVGDITSRGFGQMAGLTGQAVGLLGVIANNSRVQTASAVFATVLTATKILAAGGGGAKAGGGLIEGPGTDTSDSIFALLSNNEYVIRASSVRSIGTRVLDYINSFGELPGFALGGLVGELPALDLSAVGGGTFRQTNIFQLQTEKGGVSKASQAQIERDVSRATTKGARRSIASRK